MKATELMIGDWVLAYGKKTQIVWVGNIHKMAVRGFPYEFMDGEIEPIPLTQEILEKNGFNKNYHEDDLCYAQSCGDVIGIHIYGINGLMEEMYFKYVHELQHALRLCGIEKEIKL